MKRALLLSAMFALSTLAGGCAKVGELDPFAELLFLRSPDQVGSDPSAEGGIDPVTWRTVIGCGPEVDRDIERQVVEAYGECRDAWNTRASTDFRWGLKASVRMMDLKVLFEAYYEGCHPDELVPDFWGYFQVWRPGDVWPPEWEWCFGGHSAHEPTCTQ